MIALRPYVFLILSMSVLLLTSCARLHPTTHLAPHKRSYLNQGKRDFEAGYYKSAMKRLLPLACEGDPEAEYAVGYLYYYGYGVAQDTDVGYFWIQRAARHGDKTAQDALPLLMSPDPI